MGRGRGVNAGGGQSSLGYLFGDGEASASQTATKQKDPIVDTPTNQQSAMATSDNSSNNYTTNNYFRADGQNRGNFLTERPTTKVQFAPGGNSSLSYLFGGGSNSK